VFATSLMSGGSNRFDLQKINLHAYLLQCKATVVVYVQQCTANIIIGYDTILYMYDRGV